MKHPPGAKPSSPFLSRLSSLHSTLLTTHSHTTPTPHLWKKHHSNACTLCHQPDQNLIHVVNNCKTALDLRRHDERRDRVLQSIATTIRAHLPPSTSMAVDLSGGYAFPTHIAATDLRPDVVWWNDSQKTITLVELTVCFETSYEAASTRKVARYLDLTKEAREGGYTPTLVTLEMGSRGLPNMTGFQLLRDALNLCTPEFRKLLLDTSQQAILGSYKIWCSRNNILS